MFLHLEHPSISNIADHPPKNRVFGIPDFTLQAPNKLLPELQIQDNNLGE